MRRGGECSSGCAAGEARSAKTHASVANAAMSDAACCERCDPASPCATQEPNADTSWESDEHEANQDSAYSFESEDLEEESLEFEKDLSVSQFIAEQARADERRREVAPPPRPDPTRTLNAKSGKPWELIRVEGGRREAVMGSWPLSMSERTGQVTLTAGMNAWGQLRRRDVFRAEEEVWLWPPGEEPACLGRLESGRYELRSQCWAYNPNRPSDLPMELHSGVQVLPTGIPACTGAVSTIVSVNVPADPNEDGCKIVPGQVSGTFIPFRGDDGKSLGSKLVVVQYEVRFPLVNGKAYPAPIVVFSHGAANAKNHYRLAYVRELLLTISKCGYVTLSVNTDCGLGAVGDLVCSNELNRAHLMRAALRDFANRYPEFVNGQRVAMAGHSQGASAAILASNDGAVAVPLPATMAMPIHAVLALAPSDGSEGGHKRNTNLAGVAALVVSMEADEDLGLGSSARAYDGIIGSSYKGLVHLACSTHWSGILGATQGSYSYVSACPQWGLPNVGTGPDVAESADARCLNNPAPACLPTFAEARDKLHDLTRSFLAWQMQGKTSERNRFVGKLDVLPATKSVDTLLFRTSSAVQLGSQPKIAGNLSAVNKDKTFGIVGYPLRVKSAVSDDEAVTKKCDRVAKGLPPEGPLPAPVPPGYDNESYSFLAPKSDTVVPTSLATLGARSAADDIWSIPAAKGGPCGDLWRNELETRLTRDFTSRDPRPGYVLDASIPTGGYLEVWFEWPNSASGPTPKTRFLLDCASLYTPDHPEPLHFWIGLRRRDPFTGIQKVFAEEYLLRRPPEWRSGRRTRPLETLVFHGGLAGIAGSTLDGFDRRLYLWFGRRQPVEHPGESVSRRVRLVFAQPRLEGA